MTVAAETFWNESVIKMTKCPAEFSEDMLFNLSTLAGRVTSAGSLQRYVVFTHRYTEPQV